MCAGSDPPTCPFMTWTSTWSPTSIFHIRIRLCLKVGHRFRFITPFLLHYYLTAAATVGFLIFHYMPRGFSGVLVMA